MELALWLRSQPRVPGLDSAPDGWFKLFRDFCILGEGEHMKTLYTKYVTGEPGKIDRTRPNAVNLDEWLAGRARNGKPTYMPFQARFLRRVA